MSGPIRTPRPEQIAELTRGVRLPLGAVPMHILEVVVEGLRQAFAAIRLEHPQTVATGEEPEVTALMQARLNKHGAPLWRWLVQAVVRGAESVSFDGSHLQKRPDLHLFLAGADRRFPLAVETKILDAKRSKRVRLYCEEGIRRFVAGEYAWANREAFMVGYVRDGASIDGTLTPFLSQDTDSDGGRYLVQALPSPVPGSSADLATTRHGRNFTYGGQPPPNRPGPITLWHLWVS